MKSKISNLKTDKNKGITNITYNHLNLPVEITFATGRITYTYDATGTKVKKVVTPTTGAVQTSDYLFGFEYENGVLQNFPHAEGYVKNNGGNYVYHYIYKDHLGNNRLVYADLNNDGVIQPATEIVEENNYYPFGLKHQGYNELPGADYKYKFLNKEYEDSFALNITETDFRHYDSALGRFNVMDMLSELAYDHTPYRYGFNNPVFWQDASGLFESRDDAQQWINRWGLSGAEISYNWGKGYYEILNEGVSFYQQGEDIIRTMYSWSDSGGMTISYDTIKGGAGNGTGSFLNAFFKFMETGGIFNIWGVLRDDPGFKPNSRKRSAVDVSMNYDQVFNPAATSLMAGKNWMARLKDWLGGMDTRASNVAEGLNRSEAKTKNETSSDGQSGNNKAEREIIKIQIKVYSFDKFEQKATSHTHYYESIYKDQESQYHERERQDSMNVIERGF